MTPEKISRNLPHLNDTDDLKMSFLSSLGAFEDKGRKNGNWLVKDGSTTTTTTTTSLHWTWLYTLHAEEEKEVVRSLPIDPYLLQQAPHQAYRL